MAIAEMSKLRLIGLTDERNGIMNALAKTGCAEIKECALPENTAFKPDEAELGKFNEKFEKVESCIARLSNAVEVYARDNKRECDFLGNGFDVAYGDFMSIAQKEQELLAFCDEAERTFEKVSDERNEIVRLNARAKSLAPFSCVKESFSQFENTKYAAIYFGTIPADRLEAFKEYADSTSAVDYEEWEPQGNAVAVMLAAHKTVADEAFAAISALGFQRAPFSGEFTARQLLDECDREIKNYEKTIAETEEAIFESGKNLKELKILSDYYAFEIEKLQDAERFPQTASSFMLEAYVPKEAQEKVSAALSAESDYVYFEYEGISDDEMPPSLIKNNKVVRNFEFVTDMYTPPNYREFDPNAVMSVFFSIFMGFIMADIGYGLLMMIGGFLFAAKQKKDTALKRLASVLAIGGICAIIFGVLLNSFFGVQLSFLSWAPLSDINATVMLGGGAIKDLPLLLLLALLMGVVQLTVSNLCRAYAEFREGRIWDGIFFGVVWAIFLIGLIMIILGMTEEFGMSYLTVPGAITAVAALFVGAVTAGMHEKGFGKVTKGFGAVYGIINYFSDILSYSRLYGLMLSGVIIAQIVSENALKMFASGSVALILLGVIIMIIGHAFNLFMGLLSAYIHDARLQYIEFFSRFYTGEGERFAPLGSKHNYVADVI